MKIHTDSGFTIEIQKNHGIVTELEGNPQIVEIPREVEGIPITELGAYLFSGKNCQVIRIPQGVKKIGRYGFYNCRKLEELWFSSEFYRPWKWSFHRLSWNPKTGDTNERPGIRA